MQCFTSHRVSGLASRSTCGHAQKNSSRTSTGLVGCRLGKDFHRAIKSRAGNDVDNIDLRQEVDIERLINLVHDLEDKYVQFELHNIFLTTATAIDIHFIILSVLLS